VKKVRVFPKLVQQEKKLDASLSNLFVFSEKATGVAQFRAESRRPGDLTAEHIAGVLAMQCLVRGQEPGDFEVLIPAERTLVGRLVSRAQELLEAGRAAACPTSLSPRQKEILCSVLCNRANKEIASKLNITVRTVKFHISTLLEKFRVENRAELARRAAGFLRPTIFEGERLISERATTNDGRQGLGPVALDATTKLASRARSIRFPGRILTA
jgi:DNA-binding CsgD family transcriptional regulator